MKRSHFGLVNQIEGQKPSGERKFCGLNDRAGREGGLMVAAAALIALEPPAIDEPMLVAITAPRTEEAIWPASLF